MHLNLLCMRLGRCSLVREAMLAPVYHNINMLMFCLISGYLSCCYILSKSVAVTEKHPTLCSLPHMLQKTPPRGVSDPGKVIWKLSHDNWTSFIVRTKCFTII